MDYQLETVLEMPDSEISADSPVRMHRRVMSSSTTKSKSTHKEKMTNQIWYLAQAHKDLDRKSLMIQNRLKELHIGNYVDLR